jgi:hypothetical protein
MSIRRQCDLGRTRPVGFSKGYQEQRSPIVTHPSLLHSVGAWGGADHRFRGGGGKAERKVHLQGLHTDAQEPGA